MGIEDYQMNLSIMTRFSGGTPSAVRWNQLLADRSFAALFLSRHPFVFGNLV